MKNFKLIHQFSARFLLTAVFLLSLVAGFTVPAAAAPANGFGAVYTSTNASSGNQVLVFNRAVDGRLAFQGAYATGGLWANAGLWPPKPAIPRQTSHRLG